MGLDSKDKRLLSYLCLNSRTPLSQLAKKAAMSKDSAGYRLRRLISEHIILDFVTEIDEKALGFDRYLVYLAFQHIDEKKEQQIMHFITTHSFVSWTTTSSGRWSVIIDFLARNAQDVHFFVETLKSLFDSCVSESLVVPLLWFEHYPEKIFGEHFSLQKKKNAQEVSLDKRDIQILAFLANNARSDYVSLAKHLHLTANAIKYRIRHLLNNHIIQRFTIYPNKRLLGYEHYYIQILFLTSSEKQEKELIGYLQAHPNVSAIYKPLSGIDLEFSVFVSDSGVLRTFILKLRNAFGSFIKLHDTILFYEESKANYLPLGVFQQAI